MKKLFNELKKKIADGTATETEKKEYERLYIAIALREQGQTESQNKVFTSTSKNVIISM